MASETEHNVKVNILGDASNLEKEMKEAAADINKFQKQADRTRAVDKRTAKQVDKLVKKSAKDKEKFQKKSLDLEKRLTKSVQDTVKGMRGKDAVSKKEVDGLDKQTKALKKLTDARRDLEKAEKIGARGGEGGAGGGGKRRTGIVGRTAAGVGKKAASAAWSFVKTTAMADLNATAEYKEQQGQAFAGTGLNVGQSNKLREAGKESLFTPQEVMKQATQLLTSTGSAKVVTDVLPEIMKLSRTQGVDAGAFQGVSATMTRGGGVEGKQLKESVAAGMVSGLKKGRLTEYLQAIDGLMQQQQQISTADTTGSGINALMAQLGSTGVAGLQGARGAGVASKIDASIRNPQGEAAEMLMLQAIGMGDSKSFVQAKEIMQEGILSDDTGMDTMKNVFKRIEELGGGNTEETQLLGSEALGLTIRQFKDVQAAMKSTGTDEEIRKKIQEVTDEKTPEGEMVERLKQSIDVQHNLVTRMESSDTHMLDLQKAIEKLKTDLAPVITKLIEAIAGLAEDTHYLIEEFKKLTGGTPEGGDPSKPKVNPIVGGALSKLFGIDADKLLHDVTDPRLSLPKKNNKVVTPDGGMSTPDQLASNPVLTPEQLREAATIVGQTIAEKLETPAEPTRTENLPATPFQ